MEKSKIDLKEVKDGKDSYVIHSRSISAPKPLEVQKSLIIREITKIIISLTIIIFSAL